MSAQSLPDDRSDYTYRATRVSTPPEKTEARIVYDDDAPTIRPMSPAG